MKMTALRPPAEMASWTKDRPPILRESNYSVPVPTSTGPRDEPISGKKRLLGSVKSMIGHGESASGIAGLVKVICVRVMTKEQHSIRVPILTYVKSKVQDKPLCAQAQEAKSPAEGAIIEPPVISNNDPTNNILVADVVRPSQCEYSHDISSGPKFIPGEVFKVLWSEPRGVQASCACYAEKEDGAFFKHGKCGPIAYRRLVVDTTMSESFEGFGHYPSVSHRLINVLPLILYRPRKSEKTKGTMPMHPLLVILPYAHRASVDIPAYLVALPWPRKPPWSTITRSSNKAHKNSMLELSIILMQPQSPNRTAQVLSGKMTDTADNTTSQWSQDPIFFSDWVKIYDPESSDQMCSLAGDLDFSGCQENGYTSSHLECALAASFVSGPRVAKRAYDRTISTGELETTSKRKYQKRNEDDSDIQRPNVHTSVLSPSIDPERHTFLINTEIQDEKVTEKRFACPFLKHNQAKYGKVTACLASWPTISRLKEHIRRRHASDQYRCNRCLIKCENHSQLDEHLRADPPCSVIARDPVHDDKLDDLQLAEIKKKSRRGTDVEKWNNIYRIIFRLGVDAQTPSPFWENITVGVNTKDCESDTLSQFEDHLRRQLTKQNAAEIQTCLKHIQGFLQVTQGSSSSQSSSENGSQSIIRIPSAYSDSCDDHSQPSSNADTDTDYSCLLRGINFEVPNEFELGAEAFTQNFDMHFGLSSNVEDGKI